MPATITSVVEETLPEPIKKRWEHVRCPSYDWGKDGQIVDRTKILKHSGIDVYTDTYTKKENSHDNL